MNIHIVFMYNICYITFKEKILSKREKHGQLKNSDCILLFESEETTIESFKLHGHTIPIGKICSSAYIQITRHLYTFGGGVEGVGGKSRFQRKIYSKRIKVTDT